MSAAPQGSVEFQLRYRALGDVLFAQLDPAGLSDGVVLPAPETDEVEYVDADCVVHWARVGPLRVLRSVQVIGSAARLRQGRFPDLPPAFARAAAALIERSTPTLGEPPPSVSDSVVLSLGDLSLAERSDRDGSNLAADGQVSLVASGQLVAALVHLAGSLAAEVGTPTERGSDDDDSLPTFRFVRSIHELAGAIAEHRRPAPGLASRAVELVRGGLPVSRSEHVLLRQALIDIDRPATWRAVARGLEALAHTIDDQRRLRLEEGR